MSIPTTMLFAFLFMLLMVAIMAIGVMLGRKPITGSCGGMKALGMDMACEICGGNPALCENEGDSPDQDPARRNLINKLASPAANTRSHDD